MQILILEDEVNVRLELARFDPYFNLGTPAKSPF